jgi:phosphate transport system permease protein
LLDVEVNMNLERTEFPSELTVAGRPLFLAGITILLLLIAIGYGVAGVLSYSQAAGGDGLASHPTSLLLFIIATGGLLALAWGIWTRRSWAHSGVRALLVLGLLAFLVTVVFDVSADIFAGETVVPIDEILKTLLAAVLRLVAVGIVPAALLFGLRQYSFYFEESIAQRNVIDRGVRYILLATALSAIFIVFLIILFTAGRSLESIREIGLNRMLFGTVWRPGSIIGEVGQYGLVPMVIGSILSTLGAVILGVPLSVGTAILLAEVAPDAVRELIRPAIELLAGIPSVVYGLFGMVVLAPLIQKIKVPYNTGYGLLNASIILAVMIIPTVTNITEDAIRAVPRRYKEASLALGATHWQTIRSVILPAARSGIIAAIILGIGRALGETMALIMVIGNSIAIPEPLVKGNPLTLFLSPARTLTGNIAVEIGYAEGPHRSALFFTGVLLFAMILLVNTTARYMMRERLSS